MRARFLAVLVTGVMVAAACSPAASPSPAASSAAPSVAATSAAPSVVASSAAPSASARASVLRVARISDFLPSIFPTTLGTGNQELMADLVFSRLVDVDKDEVTIIPSLATSWDASADATVYTFHLDPRAVWSDGTAGERRRRDLHDLVGRPERQGRLQAAGVEEWLNVKGADAVKGTKNIPEGLKKIDDHTIEITPRPSRIRPSCAASPAPSTTSCRSTCSRT